MKKALNKITEGTIMDYRARSSVALFCAALMLQSCGGGGGGSASGSGGATQSSGVYYSLPVSVPLNSSVPTPSYPAGSFALGYFDTLNQIRGLVGVGLLAQNTSLDVASQHHADYTSMNYDPATMNGVIDPTTGLLYAHSEDVGKPLFYAPTPQQRDTLAGYQNTTSEVGVSTYSNDSYGGISGVQEQMNTVYHRAAILSDQPRFIGIGSNSTSTASPSYGWSFEDTGMVLNPATLPAGAMAFYPTPNGTMKAPFWETSWEQPSPLPSVPTTQHLGGGISVQVGGFDSIAVTTFTLTDASGNNVPVYQENPATDSSGYLPGNIAFIIPQAPLNLATSYTTRFVGTDNGTTISRTWTFNTPPNILTVTTPGPYILHNGGTINIQTEAPSGYVGYNWSSSVPTSDFTVAMDGDMGFNLSLAAGSVTAPTPLQITLSDPYYPSVTTMITVTLEP